MDKFENAETLVKVENLCQFFKMGTAELKAVNNVSFDIKRGEVYGLVGESGCGKTTTGRTIIKLYDATSGNVYFKGQRIVAGVRSYKDNIKAKQAWLKAELNKLNKDDPDYESKRGQLHEGPQSHRGIKIEKEQAKDARHPCKVESGRASLPLQQK